MDVVIAGGHGQVALRLERLLADAGHRARGLIRNPDHEHDVVAVGGRPVLCDLEAVDDLSEVVRGADAVVFSAGAGPGSGPARKRTVDYGAAVRLMDAAQAAGVDRYVMVSSLGVDRPHDRDDPMLPYFEAKSAADAELRASGLAFTIIRPGSLTDEPGTGRVVLAEHLGALGSIPRDDVALLLYAILGSGALIGRTVEVIGGGTPIGEALASA